MNRKQVKRKFEEEIKKYLRKKEVAENGERQQAKKTEKEKFEEVFGEYMRKTQESDKKPENKHQLEEGFLDYLRSNEEPQQKAVKMEGDFMDYLSKQPHTEDQPISEIMVPEEPKKTQVKDEPMDDRIRQLFLPAKSANDAIKSIKREEIIPTSNLDSNQLIFSIHGSEYYYIGGCTVAQARYNIHLQILLL